MRKNKLFPICHGYLNSITAHGYSKVSLLKAYVTSQKMDIICLVVNLLGCQMNNGNLKILGYNLVRTDHPSNGKRGGVCIYYKALLSLRGNIIDSHRYLFSVGMQF